MGRKELMEAVNSSGGLWFQSEFVQVAGWATPTATIAPTWGGHYSVSWEEVERAYKGDGVILYACRSSDRWRGVRQAPKHQSYIRPPFACSHL